MIIDTLLAIVGQASELPFVLWKHNYFMAKKSLLADFDYIQENVEKNNKSSKKLKNFLNILKKDEITELELAKSLVSMADLFSLSGVEDDKITAYKSKAEIFLARVMNENRFEKRRQKIQESKSEEEQKDYDKKRFLNEGLSYCLLYYLTYYKKLTSLKTPEEKNSYSFSETVDLGYGDLPGIKKGFEDDTTLDKFVLLILDDVVRENLVREYY